MTLDAALSLSAANKRIANILRGADDDIPEHVDESLLREDGEQALHRQVAALTGQVEPLLEARRYAEALTALASLREAVDAFFDHVLVMADDDALRRNRLALLAGLRRLFLQTADFSHIHPARQP